MLDPLPFEISGSGISAVCSDPGPGALCSCGRGVDSPGVLVGFAGEGEAKMFRLRGQRFHKDGRVERIEMLVAELNGVRTYLRRDAQGHLEVVISTLDLQP